MNEVSGGISFTGALFLLFLGLKLGEVIDWSWVWVFAPLWIPIITAIIIALVIASYLLIKMMKDKIERKIYERRNKEWLK